MAIVKTLYLKGPALDWAVALAEGYFTTNGQDLSYWESPAGVAHFLAMRSNEEHVIDWTRASSDWSYAGLIIERERITIIDTNHGFWGARPKLNFDKTSVESFATTALAAAMICYVQSKIGLEINVPNELL